MTGTQRTPEADFTTALPAATRQALEKVQTAKSAWLAARKQQTDAATMAATIKRRRQETEAEAKLMNEEWRELFRENQGSMTPRMKKLRTDIALARETLNEFDELLNTLQTETETLPWASGDRAKEYITAHKSLMMVYSHHVWSRFMAEHGEEMMQALSLRMHAMELYHAGGYEGVDDAETKIKQFIRGDITEKAMKHSPSTEGDALLSGIGLSAESQAHHDARNAPSPMTRHTLFMKREMAAKDTAQ
uniref:phage polarity suppression protein n=1 Tax=Pantoea sp. IMH TaxID=1267600 RepID=UPI000468153D|nr:hypothetical protein [Pantoea sp. IMH]